MEYINFKIPVEEKKNYKWFVNIYIHYILIEFKNRLIDNSSAENIIVSS